MEQEINRFWLPHYTIEKGKVIFLKKYDTGIRVPYNLNSFIKDSFIPDNMYKIISPNISSKLLQEGIIIPWDINNEIHLRGTQSRCIAIQPHSDDIAFSCGGFVRHLINRMDIKVDILTVFSSQRYFGSSWSHIFSISDLEYQELRRMEDDLFSRYTGCGLSYLEYKDANLRSKISVLAKTGLLRQDLQIKASLKNDFRDIFLKLRPKIILLPLAIGLHRDHLIVNEACMELLEELTFIESVYLYEDYPYCNMGRYLYFSRLHEVCKEYRLRHLYVDIQEYLLLKSLGINFYRSQLYNLSLKNIQNEIKKTALAVTYEGKIHDEINEEELLYTESIWKLD